MSESFQLLPQPQRTATRGRRTVAVTGAGGRIGRSFCRSAHERYRLRLLVRTERKARTVSAFGTTVTGELADIDLLKDTFAGCDTVLHLAADPSPSATWDSVQRNNIEGTYNVFVAAKAAGCRRVLYASSIHAVSGYHPGHQVHPDEPVNPGDLYGVSKCFGEAMARYMATQHDLSSIVIRIGSLKPAKAAVSAETARLMNSFVSHRDLNQLFRRCIDDHSLRFAIFHGLSGNAFNRMDIQTAVELVGYDPADDFTELNRSLAKLQLRAARRPHSERGLDEPSGIRQQI